MFTWNIAIYEMVMFHVSMDEFYMDFMQNLQENNAFFMDKN